jgi:hypothetical protein
LVVGGDAGASAGAGRRRRPEGGTAARRGQVLGLVVLTATCHSGGESVMAGLVFLLLAMTENQHY